MAYVTTPLEAEAGQTPDNKRRCGTTICRCLCNLVGGALLVGLLGCSLLLLVTVIYDQANTDQKLPEFKVESATMTQLNIEGPQLSAAWDITLLATNPRRRLESHYSFVQAEVRFRDGFGYVHTLVKQPVPSFVLNRRNNTRVGLKLGLWGQPGGQVVRGISDERKSEVVTFGVRLLAKVWFKKYSWLLPQPRGLLQVSCDNVDFEFSGKNGTGEKTSQSGWCYVNYDYAFAGAEPGFPWWGSSPTKIFRFKFLICALQ